MGVREHGLAGSRVYEGMIVDETHHSTLEGLGSGEAGVVRPIVDFLAV